MSLLSGIGGQILTCSELFLYNNISQNWLSHLHHVLEEKLVNEPFLSTHCSGLQNLNSQLSILNAQLFQWEQTFLLVSPIAGVVTFTKYWQKNQNVNAGEVLITVVPNEETKIVGKILLPSQGAGKVKEGQSVNVKFDNFPYMEFGMVRVQIKNISLVPVTVENNQKAYLLEVDFPDKLKTNYGKELTFSQEMTGIAEIITEDLRLLDKFLNPIKAVIKK